MKTTGTPRGEPMDEFLKSIGCWRKPVAKDGSCLFRAVAEQIFHCQAQHLKLREACINYIERNRARFEAFIEGPFDHYLFRLRDPKEWAGQVEISALSLLYKHDFLIFQDIYKPAINITQNGFKDKVLLCFSNGNHYDSVFSIKYPSSAAICQSIVYDVLYRNVFKMDPKELETGVAMVRNKSFQKHRKDSVGSTGSVSDKADSPTPENQHQSDTDSQHTDAKGDHNRRSPEYQSPPFPFRVAKSLDPEIFRNVEYDTWGEALKDQQQRDFKLASDLQFLPGDKCQVTLEGYGGKLFNAHIQEMTPEKGPVTVFIEELGSKHTIPYDSMKHLPQPHHSWSIVGGKNYKQLSGFYQKSPQPEQDNGMSKKKNRKKRDLHLMMPFGRGQALPPRLQPQNEHHQQRPGYGRGGGSRTPPPRFGGHQRQIIDSSGHPIRKHWGHKEKYPHPPAGSDLYFYPSSREVYLAKNYYPPTPPQDGSVDMSAFSLHPGQQRPSMAELERRAIEESMTLYELQERDTNAFPALPSARHNIDGPPRQFWDGKDMPSAAAAGPGEMRKEDGATHQYIEQECGGAASDVSRTPTPPQPIPQVPGVNAHTAVINSYPSPVPSPTIATTPPPGTQPNMHQQCPQGPPCPPGGATVNLVPPSGAFPFYPFLVIPHIENLPSPINYNAGPSREPSGADLPLNDPSTLRFFYNLGCEYYRMSSIIQMQHQQQYAALYNPQIIGYHGNSCPQQPRQELATTPEEDTCIINGQSHDEGFKNTEGGSNVAPCKIEEVSLAHSSEEDLSNCSDCPHQKGFNDSGCVSDVSVEGAKNIQNNHSLGFHDNYHHDHHGSESSDSQSNHSDSYSQHSNVSTASSSDSNPCVNNRPKRSYVKKINGVPHKLVRPMKDIPPRFQKILSQESSRLQRKKLGLEGPPLVRQLSTESPEGSSPIASASPEVHEKPSQFNPNAQCFVPSQNLQAPNSQSVYNAMSGTNQGGHMPYMNAPCTPDSQLMTAPSGADGSSSFSTSMVMGPQHPTYTIHITSNQNTNTPVPSGDGNVYYPSVAISNTGYYGNGGGASSPPGVMPPQPPMYYTTSPAVYPNQQYVQYTHPAPSGVMYGTPPPQYAAQPAPCAQGPYPMSV